MMSTNFNDMSDEELQRIISDAQKALDARKEKQRKEVLAKIKDLAASIDVAVEVSEGPKASPARRQKVAVKYRNPRNPSEQWTGRGMKPKWLRTLLEAGHSLDEFKV